MTESRNSEKSNKLDGAFSAFVEQYRYEIIASLSLVALIGGIVLVLILNKEKSEVVYSTTENQTVDTP